MKFNYGLEKKKFDEIWNRLEKEYAATGMSQHAIEEMKTYDWNVFKKERTFYRHNQRINEELLDCGDEVVGKEIGLKKYIDSFGSEDKYFMDRKDGWIEELDNEEIIIYLKEYFTYWLEDVKRKGLSADSYDSYKNVIYNHVIPYFNDKLLCHIKMSDVRDLYNEKMKFSPSVTKLIKTIMNTSMDYAKTHNLASYNPARGVNLPKQIEKKEYRKRVIDTMKTLNLEQILTLIKASEGTSIHMQILFAVLMGLRRGEINGLKYSDVDFINRTLTINRQLGRAPNTKKTDVKAKTFTKQEIPTKTRSSERTLNIPDYVFEEILKERAKYEKNRNRRKKDFNDQDYICCSSYGNSRSMSFHFKPYKKLLEECGLPDIRWHDLRTTFCTLLLKNDYSPKAVSKIMGHAKEIITLDVYADNVQIIADGVQDMQSFIDDVIPDEEELYKEHTDVMIDLGFLSTEDNEMGIVAVDIAADHGIRAYENVC